MSLEFDPTSFLNALNIADKAMRKAARKGLRLAGRRLLRDTVIEEPTVPKAPHWGGTLRGSGSVFVEGELTYTSSEFGKGKPALTMTNVQRLMEELAATVAYNTPYAAVMHEGEWKSGPLAGVQIQNYSEPGSGKNFLTQKLVDNPNRYPRILADQIRKELGGD